MPVDEKTALAGLFTNLAETQAPPGTLLEAENVVMRRPGCIEPRDGLQLAGTLSSGFAAYGYSWRSKDWILRNNGSHAFDWRDTAGGTYQITEPLLSGSTTFDPQPMRRDVFSHAEARASVYAPYSGGVMKMDTDAATWKYAGIPHALTLEDLGASGSFGAWLPNTEKVAYRAVLKRKDANGLILRSKPTGFVITTNGSGGAAGTQVRILVYPNAVILWDSVELYRTSNTAASVAITDEMQLVRDIPKSEFTFLSGGWLIDFTDTVQPAARGLHLYTAQSRGGANEANERPPAAAVVKLYRGSMFFGNVRTQRKIKVSATFLGAISSATGLGVRTYTGDITNGSNQILNMSSTTGLEKGMFVTVGSLGTFVTGISGTTVTVQSNSNATAVGASLSFQDAVKLGGNWLRIAEVVVGNSFPRGIGLSQNMLAQSITPPEDGHGATFVFEQFTRDTTVQTIQATHGSEYTPPLPGYDGTPLALEQDVWPGVIAWSKTDEPEHVRALDRIFVGDQNKAILALTATRDALYIHKEDGLFRLTGARGVWRVDPVDPTARIVLPSSARALRGRGVFLGDRGLATVSDEGSVELVSAPVNDQLKPLIDLIQANWLATGFYELPGMAGGHASCVLERESEYTLARGSATAPLVYNDVTGAWTTLAYYGHGNEGYAYKALFNFERSGHCVLSLGTSYFKTLLSTEAGALPLRYDRATAVTVNSYAAPNATLSAAINALEDDVIKDSDGKYWRVLADVNASATVPVTLSGGDAAVEMASGVGTLYRSLRCTVVATGFTMPMSAQKCRGGLSTSWTKLVGPVRMRYGYQSSLRLDSGVSPVWVEEEANTALTKASGDGDGFVSHEFGASPVNKTVPIASKRAWLMRARIRWAQVHGDAQLEGIHSDFVPLPAGAPQQEAP